MTQNGNDVKEVIPLVEEMEKNLGGEKPDKISCDGGYFSEENIEYLSKKEIDAYIPAPNAIKNKIIKIKNHQGIRVAMMIKMIRIRPHLRMI